jgi:hypothetical protein
VSDFDKRLQDVLRPPASSMSSTPKASESYAVKLFPKNREILRQVVAEGLLKSINVQLLGGAGRVSTSDKAVFTSYEHSPDLISAPDHYESVSASYLLWERNGSLKWLSIGVVDACVLRVLQRGIRKSGRISSDAFLSDFCFPSGGFHAEVSPTMDTSTIERIKKRLEDKMISQVKMIQNG